ncbi:hypothetical protein [Chitinimonas sp. BJB300]|uniref:hypothetical protein n=1 Tax=Chitinimonas sp. BJB300 TaxID=1559339 RepID=UPI000C0CB58C|nr:hypothetical protein [Chitinimonas sp. BJB300]PHV12360.1 hypothetical protein CSQ89_06055 [Chitinimonas sp. BJB300]TSJ91070.1 hypothetical protein FG002_001840 [Chitinimonas sp. BJB300]
MRIKLRNILLICFLFSFAAWAGGKHFSNNAASGSTTRSASSLTITDIHQQLTETGNLVIVYGTGMLGVSHAAIDDVTMKFSADSDDRLTIEVPQNTKLGLIELQAHESIVHSIEPIA